MKKLQQTVSLALTLALSAIGFSSCTSGQKLPPDLAASESMASQEVIALLGTNDIHGALAPIAYRTRETDAAIPSVPYERGGAVTLASHVRILRSQLGNRMLWLDAGDEFQGTLESNLQEGAPMVQFFNALGLNAAAIGNHEFDFGPVGPEGTPGDPQGALKARMSEAKYPYLGANILEKTTGKPPAFPNLYSHIILKAGKLKVGIIGLSTPQTPVTTRAEYVQNLKFEELKQTTLREAHALRLEGAQVVVIVAHAGLRCSDGKKTPDYSFRKPADPQGECESGEEIPELLHALPSGTVDAVISGHTHTVVHHWINGVPIIQSGTRNLFYNVIYLTFDMTQGKVLTEKTRIEGPVPVCPRVFENQNDCNGDRPAPKVGRGPLVTPLFHGRTVEPDPAISELLQPTFERVAAQKMRVVGQAARPIDHNRSGESEIGNLVTDAIRLKSHSQVALMNGGGIRAPFEPGPITYEALFRALPFDNSIVVLRVMGSQLKNILRVAESGSRGFFPVSGVRLRLIDPSSTAPSSDLNHDHKIDAWEINRLLDAKLEDGSPIYDDRQYTLATVDFLVTGGDDMGWAMSQVPKDKIQILPGGLIRDAVETYLSRVGPINTLEKPLVNPAARRMTFVKPQVKVKGKGRRHRKKKRH